MIKEAKKFDVAVIGGGPAGMMAAIQASTLGARVVLLEKNNRLGAKLLITGGGRCNLTNDIADARVFVEKIGHKGKFLFSALHRFGVTELREFFASRGVPTKVEENGRVFPVSDRAVDVLRALVDELKKNKVEIKYEAEVVKIIAREKQIQEMVLKSGEKISAGKYIICTGGKSYAATGSSGEAYGWLEKLGHNIIAPRPVLAPVIIKEKFIKELEGLSFKNVRATIFIDNKKGASRVGEIIFTANGLSGPMILDLSGFISPQSLASSPLLLTSSASDSDRVSHKALAVAQGRGSTVCRSDVDSLPLSRGLGTSAGNDGSEDGVKKIKLDFLPEISVDELDKKFQHDFQIDGSRMIKNILEKILPPRLAILILRLAAVDKEKKACSIAKEERRRIAQLIKEFRLEVDSVAGFDKAMVTAGGVDLCEVDPKTMKSKIIENLFLAGEVLDLDGPTGGYNLQICWSTGFVAGNSIIE